MSVAAATVSRQFSRTCVLRFTAQEEPAARASTAAPSSLPFKAAILFAAVSGFGLSGFSLSQLQHSGLKPQKPRPLSRTSSA